MSSKNSKLKNNPKPLFLRPKEIKVVTKAVLLRIANSIYDPKSRHYLNLCVGNLQAGNDPVCEARQMHCGLGEVYYVVTGRHPREDHVGEREVVDEVVRRSTIGERIAQDQRKIKKLGLPVVLAAHLRSSLATQGSFYVKKLTQVLNTIPNENDKTGVENNFKTRAQRVARVLREAAELLPR